MSENHGRARGLYLNQPQAQCSIYESGLMVFRALQGSPHFDLEYFELTPESASSIPAADFYLLNYHHATMSWLNTASVRALPGRVLTVVLEMLPGNPFVYVSPDHFDAYIVLDPTIRVSHPRTYAFPRPLEAGQPSIPYTAKSIPVIGTFGFSTPGKGFEHVVEAVGREFDEALVRINIPTGTFADGHAERYHRRPYADYLAELCRNVARPGIEVEVTRAFMEKQELVDWCAQNTLNCFLYCRNQPGLSATTDQCITAGRPLAVSANETFRHIHQYLRPYPERSLRESIVQSTPEVEAMRRDWTPRRFCERFEELLVDLAVLPPTSPINRWRPPEPRPMRPLRWTLPPREHPARTLARMAVTDALTRSHRWSVETRSPDTVSSLAGNRSSDLTTTDPRKSGIPDVIASTHSAEGLLALHPAGPLGKAASRVPTLMPPVIPLACNEQPIPAHTRVGLFLFNPDVRAVERLLPYLTPDLGERELLVGLVDHMPHPDFEARLRSLVSEHAESHPHLTFPINVLPATTDLPVLLAAMGSCTVLVCIDAAFENAVLFHYALGVQRAIALLGTHTALPAGDTAESIRLEHNSLSEIISRGIAPLLPIVNDWSEARCVIAFDSHFAAESAPPPPCTVSASVPPKKRPLNRMLTSEEAFASAHVGVADAKLAVSSLTGNFLFDEARDAIATRRVRNALVVRCSDTRLPSALRELVPRVDEVDPRMNFTVDHFYHLPSTVLGRYDLIIGCNSPGEVGTHSGDGDTELFFAQLGDLLAPGGLMLFTCALGAGEPPVRTAATLRDRVITMLADCAFTESPEWASTLGVGHLSFAIEKASSTAQEAR